MPLTKAYRIIGITHGLSSSTGAMLDDPTYFAPGEIYSQHTNWDQLEEIESGPEPDSQFVLEDIAGATPLLEVAGARLQLTGDLKVLERETRDRRWAVLGNQGLWFRHALAMQERHGIFGFHAASICRPGSDHLVILVGPAGSGKTVFLLSSLDEGWRVFSTEMTYFRLHEGSATFFRGAMMDNIYASTLAVDFPELRSQLEVELPQEAGSWGLKLCVNMRTFAVRRIELANPSVSFVFPHVERGLRELQIGEIQERRNLRRMLYANSSEKIGEGVLLHEEIPAVSLDTQALAKKRLEAVDELLKGEACEIRSARMVSTDPSRCLEGLPHE